MMTREKRSTPSRPAPATKAEEVLAWLSTPPVSAARPAHVAFIPEVDAHLHVSVARSVLAAHVTPGPLPLDPSEVPLLP